MKDNQIVTKSPKMVSNLALLLLSTGSALLTGCQSLPYTESSNQLIHDKPLIATPEFQNKMQDMHASYQQQFINGSAINSDQLAKQTLTQAIQKQLATPHVSVTQTRLHEEPFLLKGSIDEGSESIYKTILLFAADYLTNKNDYSEYNEYNEYDEYDEYDEDENYPETTEAAYEEYNEYENAADDESYYEEDSELADYNSNDDGYYESEEWPSEVEQDTQYQQLLNTLYNLYNRSPAQIEASNFYLNKNLVLGKISEFDPKNKSVKVIYSYDFLSPTTSYSIQLPVSLDFEKAELVVDPSALLPIVALATPEHAPLPEELEMTTVAFKLPEEINDKVPPSIIYDAFISAIGHSLNELDPNNFTALDISEDSYAKSLGAKSAVKLNLNSKQTGQLIGVVVKHMSTELKDYVDLRPDLFAEGNLIKTAVDNWQKANKKYQTGDVGSLMQLIEAVAPISFNKSSYYYLDGQGKLLGTQTNSSFGSDITGATSTLLSQTTYDKRSFNSHPYNELFQQSFGEPFSNKQPIHIDGNAWLEDIEDSKFKLQQAYEARYQYLNPEEEVDYQYSEDNDLNEEPYSPSISIIDYGNVNDYENNNDQ